jgi:hypothetical protein
MTGILRVGQGSEAVSAGKQPVSSFRDSVRKIGNVKLHGESRTSGYPDDTTDALPGATGRPAFWD